MSLSEAQRGSSFSDGSMSELIRNHHWETTPLGPQSQWPPHLQVTLQNMLFSGLPALLFWGREQAVLYNDAFSVHVKKMNRHPAALGRHGAEVFPETWDTIQPIIRAVSTGIIPVSSNQPLFAIPGYTDTAFHYSPVFDHKASVAGVMVIYQDVQVINRLKENEQKLNSIISQAPMAIGLIKREDLVIEKANQYFLMATGRDASIIGGPLNKAFPELEQQQYEARIKAVFTTGIPYHENGSAAEIMRNGKRERLYLDIVYAPIKNSTGEVTEIIIVGTEVTEHVVSKKAMAESEQRYRSVIKEAPIAISVFTGRQLVIEDANQSFVDMIGKDSSIIGKPLKEAMPELSDQPFLEILDTVFTTGQKYEAFGAQAQVKHGDILTNNYYDFSYTPLLNDNNEVYAILEIAIDVTTKMLAKQAIEKSEENLRNMILQAPIGMCILHGPTFITQIANEKMYELWGKGPETMLGKPVFEGLPSAKGQGLETLLENVYRTGEAFHGYEIPVTLEKNGIDTIVYQNFVYEPFKQPDGTISGILVVSNNVTDQVLARNSIIQSKAELQRITDRLQLAIDAGELGTYEVNLLTKQIIASARFKEIFNIQASTIHQDYIEMIYPEDRHIRDEAYQLALQTGVLNYTVRLRDQNNHVKWVKIRGLVNHDEQHRPVRLLGIAQDISDSKELEYQKDSFLGIASHELKTPVTSIKAYAQVMEAIFIKAGETKYADMMSRIDKQINKLNQLIGDLLDVTKINSGKLQFNKTVFNFDEMVREVSEDMQRIAPKHTIHIQLAFNGSIRADREKLIQVITNLVSNAIKYSPNASDINIYTENKNEEAHFYVQDFGIGINAQQQAKVFEQFYRVSGIKEHTFPGLGLGLYISSQIIARLGGKIWVHSTEGEGSTFCFSFPVQQV